MEGTMKAAVLEEIGRFEIHNDIPIPQIGETDILVKVKYAAICGSDLHVFNTGMFVDKLPFIIGHEFSGEIVEMGDKVEKLALGDRIMGLNINFCGECWWCKNGDFHCPSTAKGLGFYDQGAFAEYVVIKNARLGFNVHKLPDSLNDRNGALAEPCSVGWGNVDAMDVKAGDRVVVLGAGIIGLSCAVAAKAKGAEVVIMNRSKGRLEIAQKAGIDHVYSPMDGDPVDYIIDLWGNGQYPYHYGDREGGMADVVFEAVGSPATFEWAFNMVRAGGKVCIAGTATKKAEIDPNLIELKDPYIKSGLAGDFAKSVEMLANGTMNADAIITHEFTLDQIQEAFAMAADTKKSMKVVMKIAE